MPIRGRDGCSTCGWPAIVVFAAIGFTPGPAPGQWWLQVLLGVAIGVPIVGLVVEVTRAHHWSCRFAADPDFRVLDQAARTMLALHLALHRVARWALGLALAVASAMFAITVGHRPAVALDAAPLCVLGVGVVLLAFGWVVGQVDPLGALVIALWSDRHGFDLPSTDPWRQRHGRTSSHQAHVARLAHLRLERMVRSSPGPVRPRLRAGAAELLERYASAPDQTRSELLTTCVTQPPRLDVATETDGSWRRWDVAGVVAAGAISVLVALLPRLLDIIDRLG